MGNCDQERIEVPSVGLSIFGEVDFFRFASQVKNALAEVEVCGESMNP